mmetsp:Transcript_47521/g.107718  ORF Transcript_47521/g.107718 Transcript_47521/m.107718 type:complete len:277 (+) Transcript_47521:1203-2033(+)
MHHFVEIDLSALVLVHALEDSLEAFLAGPACDLGRDAEEVAQALPELGPPVQRLEHLELGDPPVVVPVHRGEDLSELLLLELEGLGVRREHAHLVRQGAVPLRPSVRLHLDPPVDELDELGELDLVVLAQVHGPEDAAEPPHGLLRGVAVLPAHLNVRKPAHLVQLLAKQRIPHHGHGDLRARQRPVLVLVDGRKEVPALQEELELGLVHAAVAVQVQPRKHLLPRRPLLQPDRVVESRPEDRIVSGDVTQLVLGQPPVSVQIELGPQALQNSVRG